MPYAPGVVDTSGQIRANFIQQGADKTAQSLNNLTNQWQQNSMMANQALGTVRGSIAANPELQAFFSDTPPQGAPPEVINLFQKLNKNGTLPLGDASKLSTFVQSYGQTKQEAQKQAYIKAQIDQAAAQTADYASQAKQRDLQNQMMQRQQDMIASIFNSKNPDAPLAADKTQPPVEPFHAPTSPRPTTRGTLSDLVNGSGQMPDVKTLADIHQKRLEDWGKIERPLGYVAGGLEKDKEGKDVQNYMLTTVKNDGSIMQAKEPIKVYAGLPPPGELLDGKTFKPLAATPTAPAIIAPANLSDDAKKDIVDGSNNINKLTIAMKYLDGLYAANEEMKKKRWGNMSGITGDNFMNNTVEPALGDSSGQMFDALGSKFVADVMGDGGVKNIRNIYEFRATTANIPKANQSPETRDSLLFGLREKIANDLARNQRALKLIQSGVSPDSAWAAATPGVDSEKVGEAQKVEKPITQQIAQQFLMQAKGDKAAARELARQAGYKF